ncbi:uncharacterized protein LOC103314859 [Tribolium castaneum]|uniref:Uncharacterized protein n=1 Tax=Tribolium castaneum TaxID=7070 RepID=D6WU01_TRICA|nr:PREDICTED: uncharacterized protein LOC103314859 [Tribolium castaneum]EFA07353.2 hypothetical protein TcasGA2_TC015953 [Tribolium castaneum]|eukprot:XP_015836990.1 PREDICTED: uncharacterized protein LOC103314859 [Tribolium castaneum]
MAEIPASGDAQSLKLKIAELETRCSDLIYENERINLDLAHEKHKVGQLERQLQFVKDNQTVFEKLREAYVCMKYNETAGRKLVEIRDKSVQTWDGVLCRACLDTEKLRKDLERAKAMYSGCIVIKRDEMDKLNTTVEALKCYLDNKYTKNMDSQIKTRRDYRNFVINSRSQSVDRGTFNKKKVLRKRCRTSKSSIDVRQKYK